MSIEKYNNICKLLKSKNIEYEEYVHKEISTYTEGIEKTDFDTNKIVKTLAFKIEQEIILIALLGKDKLDYKKLSQILGIKRNQLKMLSTEEVENLGFEIGGVCPIIESKKAKVILDTKIKNMEYIYCGMGTKDRTMKINPNDIIKINDAICFDVVKA